MCFIVCVCVLTCLRLTAVNILPVCSESRPWRAVTAKGEVSILLLALEENHGEEMRGTPIISSTSNLTHWLSSQPWWLCVPLCVCTCSLCSKLTLCMAMHRSAYSENNPALFLKQFEISGHICTVCSAATHSHSIGRILFNRALEGLWPVWLFTHSTSCSVDLLLCQGGEGDKIAALIDRVNKYSVLVAVWCSLPSNTLLVCFCLQSSTVTSCLPHTAFVN